MRPRTHDETVASSWYRRYGARHYVDRINARCWKATIPGVMDPPPVKTRLEAIIAVEDQMAYIHHTTYTGG